VGAPSSAIFGGWGRRMSEHSQLSFLLWPSSVNSTKFLPPRIRRRFPRIGVAFVKTKSTQESHRSSLPPKTAEDGAPHVVDRINKNQHQRVGHAAFIFISGGHPVLPSRMADGYATDKANPK
jgi:hypothetical protein